jgi:cytochrome P450
MSLCSVVLRPGDSISIFPVTSNMRPDLYPIPSKFDPTRFMKDSQGHPKISKNIQEYFYSFFNRSEELFGLVFG